MTRFIRVIQMREGVQFETFSKLSNNSFDQANNRCTIQHRPCSSPVGRNEKDGVFARDEALLSVWLTLKPDGLSFERW